jgi:APA family basic amino acid/polyamine antiporter
LPDSAAALPAPRGGGKLLRILGVGFGIAAAIGNTISAGIVRTPGDIAARLPVWWLFLAVWVAGGIYALISSFSFAELGAMIPREGGQMVFARRALGDYAGFIVGWSDWVSNCSAIAVISLVLGEYSGDLIPALHGRTTSVAAVVVLIVALLQWRGIRLGSRVQEITGALKALAFVGLVVACFVLGHHPAAQPITAAPSLAPSLAIGWPLGWPMVIALLFATQSVIYSYDGWYAIVYFLEEVRDTSREVHRAMIVSVLSIMGIYLLLMAGLVYVVPVSQFAGSDFALGMAAQRIFGAHGDAVIRSVMIVSLLSGVNAVLLFASRVLFAMSRDGYFTRRAASVNRGGTPDVALALSAVVTLCFIAVGSFEKVLAVTAFFWVANYSMTFLSVFVLRMREPDTPRPYRAWGYPWTTGIALAVSLAFLGGVIAGDTQNSLWAVVVLAASYPVYRISRSLSGRSLSA